MTDETDPKDISILDLDRRALGQLSPERTAALERRLESDPLFRQEAEAHEQAMAQFRQSGLPRTMEQVESRLAKRSRAPWLFAVPSLAVVAAVSFMLVQGEQSPLGQSGLAAKGDPVLQIFAKRRDSQFLVKPDMVLKKGDALKFVVQPVNYQHVLNLGIDHQQQVGAWYPFEGTQSAPIHGKAELKGSVVLDDAPGRERAVAIFSQAPQELSHWQQLLAEKPAEDIPSPEGVFVVSLSWRKAEGFGR